MTLEEYMKLEGLTETAIADRVGVSQPHIGRIRKRQRRPSPELALKIESLTGGKVSAASLNPDVALIERARGIAPVEAAA